MKRRNNLGETGKGNTRELPMKRVTRQSTQKKSRQVVDDKQKVDHQATTKLKSNESSCVTLFDSEDTHINEASKENYSILALDGFNTSNEDLQFDLVHTGPLNVGYLSTGDRILHLNFTAKRRGGSDLQTFFAELIESKQNDVSVDCVEIIGQSDLLPDEADTHGCLYCSSNIHHPHYCESFQSGGEKYWNALRSKVEELNKYARRKRIKKEDFIKRFSDPGLEYLGKDNSNPFTLESCVSAALRVVKAEEGSGFELDNIGSHGLVALPIGFILHMNFEAKTKDGPDAIKQLFFAEAVLCGSYFFINFCKCMGPSSSLPNKADLRGCCYCESGVHHPPGPGYMTGRK